MLARSPISQGNPVQPEISAVASSRLAQTVPQSLVTLVRLHAHISPIVRLTDDSINERFPVRSQQDVRPVYPSFQLG